MRGFRLLSSQRSRRRGNRMATLRPGDERRLPHPRAAAPPGRNLIRPAAAGCGRLRGMRVLRRILGVAVASLCVATAVGCGSGRRPYDTPRSRVFGDRAVAYLQREVERRGIKRTFSRAEKVETQTPSGTYAWLVRLVAEVDVGDVCGYVWRGEEAGRADSTLMRVQFDKGCRHWPK